MTIISFRSFVVSLIEELNLPHTLNKRFTNEGSISNEGSLNSAGRKGGGSKRLWCEVRMDHMFVRDSIEM